MRRNTARRHQRRRALRLRLRAPEGDDMRSYHMPMPFGWFQIAWSDEIPTGTSVPLSAFGRHLAAWRDEAGTAHVWDAFCPHMGAHFGHRAQIKGDTITCALHGWCYGAD